MIKIVWSINDINKYQTGSLPDDAVKIETPQSVGELMKKAVPIAAILCVFMQDSCNLTNIYSAWICFRFFIVNNS